MRRRQPSFGLGEIFNCRLWLRLFDMDKSVLLFLLLFSLCSVTVAQRRYSTYTNNRYVFSVDYPTDLLTPSKIEDASNSGEIFYSKNNEVEMRVWGEYNALFRTWRQEYDFEINGFGSKPTFTVLKPGWFVISGLKDGKIYYQKTLRRTLLQRDGNMDIFYTLTIEYPKSKNSKIDPLVKRISASFKFDPTADV